MSEEVIRVIKKTHIFCRNALKNKIVVDRQHTWVYIRT